MAVKECDELPCRISPSPILGQKRFWRDIHLVHTLLKLTARLLRLPAADRPPFKPGLIAARVQDGLIL